jgi:hypothetical protein
LNKNVNKVKKILFLLVLTVIFNFYSCGNVCKRPPISSQNAYFSVKQLAIGAKVKSHLPEISKFSQDIQFVDYIVCLAKHRDGYSIKQQERLRRMLFYIKFNPKSEEFKKWLKGNPPPPSPPPPPPVEYKNRLSPVMGYTRFKKMDEMTYTMAGVAYARRLVSFNPFDLAYYGYLDLTIMTSLYSEEAIESGISDYKTTFGRATSYSINYVQSVLLGNNFRLLIETGFQRLDVDLKIGNNWDKLIKDSLLLGAGLEYNYKRFFVQTNLNAVIGDDKDLGHDLDATIKTGINF